MKIIKSRIGKKLLFYNGYAYNLMREHKLTITWRCSNGNCKEIFITIIDNFVREEEHNYNENEAKI